MSAKAEAVRVGGTKRTVMDGLKTLLAFVLFVVYMIPFLLVVINSLKRKISIVKTPLQMVDDKGFQWSNF